MERAWTVSYRKQVESVAEHTNKREQRVAQIRAEVERDYTGITIDGEKVPLGHVANGRIVQDPVVRSEQSYVDRHVQLGIMYGLGAVIELLNEIAKKK